MNDADEEIVKCEDFIHTHYIGKKLAEAEARAGKQDAEWLSQNEFWENVKKL